MNRVIKTLPFVLKQIVRSPIRTTLTVGGIAIAMFLFSFVESMRNGVTAATTATAEDATLVVYRENRYCPFSSNLPEFYSDRIERIEGVANVVPIQIMVNNCRASLDVVTYRGIPEGDLEKVLEPGWTINGGNINSWSQRGDAAIVGEALAARRGIKTGDSFTAAGLTVFVAGILESEAPQDRNVAYVRLPFLQESMRRGGTGGTVTQFTVKVDDPTQLDVVAAAIDEVFEHDEFPTSTRSEKAFVGRAAKDIIELVGFASWLGWGALFTVFALVANAIIIAMRDRIRDHAVLQTLGFTGSLIGAMVMIEGALLGLAGGAIGVFAAWLVASLGRYSMTMEGLNVEISSDPLILVIGIMIALGLGILAGVVPAWRVSRLEISQCFRAV
jgi:putative ABC transport system permease protein